MPKKPMSDKKKAQVEKFIEAGKKTRFTSSAGEQQGNETQKQGGKARAKKAAERKSSEEFLKWALSQPVHQGEAIDYDSIGSIDDLMVGNKTGREAILTRLLVDAINGSHSAWVLIRDQIGEAPVPTGATVSPVDVFLKELESEADE